MKRRWIRKELHQIWKHLSHASYINKTNNYIKKGVLPKYLSSDGSDSIYKTGSCDSCSFFHDFMIKKYVLIHLSFSFGSLTSEIYTKIIKTV